MKKRVKKKVTPTKMNEAAVWLHFSKLHRWDKNPRKNEHAVPRVMQSIRRFGFIVPIVVWTEKDRMVAGDTRLKAMVRLMAEDPSFTPKGAPGPGMCRVVFHNFESEKEANAYAIADNRLNELADWDRPVLEEHMLEYREEPQLIETMGYTYEEFFADEDDGAGDEEKREDKIPEAPKNPTTKPGDIWLLGSSRLICGDCRVAGDVTKLVNGTKVNVAFTSPPYASQREYDGESGFKPIHPNDFVEWFGAVQANVASTLAPDGSWFVNIKEHCDEGQRSLYVKDLVIAHVRKWAWLFVDELCWRNTKNGVPGGWPNRFKNAWEPVFHFAKGPICFRPDNVKISSGAVPVYSAENSKSTTGSGFLGGERESKEGYARPSNVIECAASGDRNHPAAFPVALPEFFVRAYSDQGAIVLDPFMGSGTTLIACEKLGRISYGVELSPAYCDIVVERWQTFTGKKAKRSR